MRTATVVFSSLAILVALAALGGCGSRTPSEDGASRPESSAATPPPPAFDSTLVALGNEPFWNVRVAANEIVYTVPEHQEGYRFPSARAVMEGDARVYRTRRQDSAGDTGPRTLELQIWQAPCSDGMSDRQYAMRAALLIDGESRSGCAFYKGDTWAEGQ